MCFWFDAVPFVVEVLFCCLVVFVGVDIAVTSFNSVVLYYFCVYESWYFLFSCVSVVVMLACVVSGVCGRYFLVCLLVVVGVWCLWLYCCLVNGVWWCFSEFDWCGGITLVRFEL